ncbi:MAG: diadenylate cyclase CdaA [Lachnospiraceae bacterium]
MTISTINDLFDTYISKISIPNISIIDIIEIILISFFVYQFMLWVKNTKAYSLLKGILIVLIFLLIAYVFRMTTILWIAKNLATVLITGVIVIFQPELRRALEQLGRKKIISTFIPFEPSREFEDRLSDRTIHEIVKASLEMAKVKTGALIVIEETILLTEYERTGIQVDSMVSSQLLINIFEHNTPLHDGAVIIRGNRIQAATCYLPLSENRELSKTLGTRHRAGLGVSEESDCLTIIVSEETGRISIAKEGVLTMDVSEDELRKELAEAQNKTRVVSTRAAKRKERGKHEKKLN